MKSKSNEELAQFLESPQVDRTALDEAAYRLRRIELDQLLVATSTVEAINNSPILDRATAHKVESIILAGPSSAYKKSRSRLASLAHRVLSGDGYTRENVLELAATVLTQEQLTSRPEE